MEPWVWSIALLLLGLVIILIEMFVPSGGLLGVIAAMCVVASIAVAFFASVKFGLVILLVSSVLIPALLGLMIQVWPNTPLGRRIIISRPDADDVLPDNEEFRVLRKLVGKRGIAKSMMLPGGAVSIDGQNYDAVSEGQAIEAGQAVQVTAVRMHRLEVRAVAATDPQQGLAPPSGNADEMLSRPIESLGLEQLDDPLA